MPANAIGGYPQAEVYSEKDPLLYPISPTINSSTRSETDDSLAKTIYTPSPKRCIFNSVVMALLYLLAFSGFSALRNLESSISRLGELSLSIVGFSAVIGACVSPLAVYALKEKGAVVGMWLTMTLLVGANFYPVAYTLYPAGALFGFMAGPGWTSQLSYTTNTAIKYASMVGRNEEQMVQMSNGIFYFGYSCSQVIGNLISSLVLYNNDTVSSVNQSTRYQCGVNFCPKPSGPSKTESEIPKDTLYSLFGIFISGPALALLVAVLFLDPLKIFLIDSTGNQTRKMRNWKSELLAPLKIYKDVRMVLLAPVLFFSGMEQIIMFAAFTEAFVSCAIGVEYVGYVMITWGVSSALSSFMSGILSKCTGRTSLCVLSLLLAMGLQVYLFLWDLSDSVPWVYLLVSGVWGVMDGLIQTQLSAFLGLEFKEHHNAAFANFRILSYLGFAVSYASTAITCQRTQIYVTSATIGLSLVTYITVEVLTWLQHRRDKKGKHTTHRTL